MCAGRTLAKGTFVATHGDHVVVPFDHQGVLACPETAAVWCRDGRDWGSGRHATWSIHGPEDRVLGNLSLDGIDRDDQKLAMIGYRTAPWARNIGVASYGVLAAEGSRRHRQWSAVFFLGPGLPIGPDTLKPPAMPIFLLNVQKNERLPDFGMVMRTSEIMPGWIC